MNESKTCWCGEAALEPFSPDYQRCTRCGSLVTRSVVTGDDLRVDDDAQAFYGKEYWLSHQQDDLKTPDIFTRASRDLPERCLYWLRTLLKYRTPPASVLELGSAHGGFVAMLRAAGFDAEGLEVSPWVVDFSRRTFGIPVRLGPLEDQQIPAGSLDVIVLNDVLEHLPRPAETIARCTALLKPEGLLIVQTPRYDESRSYRDLVDAQDRFLDMMHGMATEHLHLLTERAARQMMEAVGLSNVAFEPPMFPYDMFFVSSRMPLAARTADEVLAALRETPSGRLVAAWLDTDETRRRLETSLLESGADRTTLAGNVEQLQALLDEANADRRSRLENATALQRLLEEANADRAARLANMQELDRLLAEANTDRAARFEQITTLSEQVNTLHTAVAASRQELAQAEHTLSDTRAERDTFDARVRALTSTLEERTRERDELRERRSEVSQAMASLRRDPIYRTLVRLGPWRRMETSLAALRAREAELQRVRLVAIDVTPILPGSENGGAKQLVLELLHGFAKERRHRYLLLTSAINHDSFAPYEALGMQRLCITGAPIHEPRWRFLMRRVRSRGMRLAGVKGRLASHGVDLLFCPMTDPAQSEPGIPTVSVVYDLQHVAYPSFFTPEERAHRDRFFQRVHQTADGVVCISQFTRSQLIETTGIEPERARAIPIVVHERLPEVSDAAGREVRARHGLGDTPFAFYPANFWPHKNHRVLLVAIARFAQERPDTPFKFVLVGNMLEQAEAMRATVAEMGLESRVCLLGYVPDADLAALWKSAFCLLFPSLFEGFGIPVLEAMRYGVPVICSDAGSLPEVGGNAVRYVDPRKPETFVEALGELLDQPALVQDLIARGRARAERFQTAEMLQSYLDLFDHVMRCGGQLQAARIDGVFGDRWMAREAVALSGPSGRPRAWSFEMMAPDWHPHAVTTIRAELDGKPVKRIQIKRGATEQVQIPVPPAGAQLRLRVSPFFVPGANGDQRELTVMLTRGQLIEADSGVVIYEL